MKILFVGTSHGIPEPQKSTSATFLCIGEHTYIIDGGADISQALRRYDIPHASVKAVFITHMHGDHFDGMPAFCDQIRWYYRDCDPQFFFPNPKCAELLRLWSDTIVNPLYTKDYHFNTYQAGVIYDDGIIKVTAIKTNHIDLSYGFLIEAEGKTVYFSGDMSYNIVEFKDLLGDKHYDLVVCEAAHHAPGALNDMLKTVDTDHLIMNHLEPVREEALGALKGNTPFKFDIAYDSMLVEI